MPGPNPNNRKASTIKGKQTLSNPIQDKMIKESEGLTFTNYLSKGEPNDHT